MSEQTTTNYGFSYYQQYDINWHTGMNNNFINLDSLLSNIEQDIKDTGSVNFIPHSLFTKDSNTDGIPELWTLSADGCSIAQSLLTSEIMGFAKKCQLTVSNSSGVTKYPELKISGLIPPNSALTFSAWLKSPDLAVQLRINDGTNNFDTVAQIEPAAVVREKAVAIAASISSINLSIRITVPNDTVSKVVEIQLPMLNMGDKAAAYCPAPGEMSALLTNDLYVFGLLKNNLDCNQKQLQQLRLHLLTSDPASPVRGQLWFDDVAGKKRPRFNDGTGNLDVSVAKQCKNWYISGTINTGVEQGGVWIVPQALTIEKVYIYCKTTGASGNTVVDVNKNSTSIFTNQGNRPSLAYNDADKKAESGLPDVTALTEGDIVSIDIDSIADGAADLAVILICR
ncbi:MAG: hypothetical protein HZA78_10520 [Candidatus Schekmanbacteria bacterium]|nr:hypothetical protein [Candidatus Schekmanbacteria bacterium]